MAAAEQEGDMWRRVNDCDSAFATKLRGTPAVGMPFAIHASSDRETQQVSFNLDISHWTLQRGADIAAHAIERTAVRGVQYDDLAWHHVALLPVFNAGEVVELCPVLIDFDRVTVGVSPAAARQTMLQKLNEMKNECVWDGASGGAGAQ